MMLKRKNLLVSIGLMLLVGLFAAASFSGGHAEVSEAADGDSTYDLAAALDSAVSGNIIILPEDTVLSRDAVIKNGVVLEDYGLSLTIQTGVKLSIEGAFNSTGNLLVVPGAQVIVRSGGTININNGLKTAEISGTLEIQKSGAVNVGLLASSTIEFSDTGELIINGSMAVGYGSTASTINVWRVTVTGELKLSAGSNFTIKEIMTVGIPPDFITDKNNTVFSGRVALDGSSYVLVYGEPSFSGANIKNSSVSTKFMVQGKVYATEYGDSVVKPNIVLPSTSDLKDFRVTGWKDNTNKTITNASGVKMGSGNITADTVKQSYTVTFTEDKAIRWVVNGSEKSGSYTESSDYGTSFTVNIRSAPGYRDLPIIFKDGAAYPPGSSFTVSEDTVFSTYYFDLVKELEQAVAGDTVELLGDTKLAADATIKEGVTLDDKGFSLTIPASVTLIIEGKLEITGKLTVEARGAVTVGSGGVLSINNTEARMTEVTGNLDIIKNGTLIIGDKKNSAFECMGNGRLFVEGTMKVGQGALNSAVGVRNMTLTGTVQISDGSTFRIYDVLTIGAAPELISAMNNPASVTGKFVLDNTAYILIYGSNEFTGTKNVKYPTVSTKFTIQGETFATLFKDQTGKRAIVLPSTSSLRDYRLIDWKDSAGNVITNSSNIQIGSVDVVLGEVVKQTYIITLKEDRSIKWVVNGVEKGSSGEETGVYGATYTINIRLASGTNTTPGILRDGLPFNPGSSFVVTGNTQFATTNSSSDTGNGFLIPMILVIAVLLGVLVVAVIVMKGRAKKAEEEKKADEAKRAEEERKANEAKKTREKKPSNAKKKK
jgi:hypothetical protein